MKLARRLVKGSAAMVASVAGPQRFGAGNNRLWVLMYHRVLPASDPRYSQEEPGMVVTPDTLRRHIRIARQLFTMVSLEEWLDRREAGKPLPPRACAITFDDGWLDNYQHALPVLRSEQVPATIFVVSEMLGTTRQFWPNRLAQLMTRFDEPNVRSACSWLGDVLPELPPNRPDNEQLALIIDHCKAQSDHWLNEQLDAAERALGLGASGQPSLMSWEQLDAMTHSGLVDVGSHTCNHFRLVRTLEAGVMAREIEQSKRQLAERLGREPTLFCYPNGDADPRAVELVRRHYRAAVTTQRGINRAGADAFQLARIGLHEDGSASPLGFQARLSGWI